MCEGCFPRFLFFPSFRSGTSRKLLTLLNRCPFTSALLGSVLLLSPVLLRLAGNAFVLLLLSVRDNHIEGVGELLAVPKHAHMNNRKETNNTRSGFSDRSSPQTHRSACRSHSGITHPANRYNLERTQAVCDWPFLYTAFCVFKGTFHRFSHESVLKVGHICS